mgnify:CR=1 FL=1
MIKAFVEGVPVEQGVWDQLKNLESLPFVSHIALMPDAHAGKGSTVGTVIATDKVIIPAAVGVDIGCGMNAVKLDLKASDLPDDLSSLRRRIEEYVPHGGPGLKGSWGKRKYVPQDVQYMWDTHFVEKMKEIEAEAESFGRGMPHGLNVEQLGTLGTGNHFIEICLDENDDVWIMLHSGSRGLGNRIGSYYIERAKEEMRRWHINLPDADLSYLPEGSKYYGAYIRAVGFAQDFALENRRRMMYAVKSAVEKTLGKLVNPSSEAVFCHHNYVAHERHYGKNLWVTRKGAVRAGLDCFGIIPGSMGAKSFIVKGKGNRESLESCSHGAGRVMSRTVARKTITLDQHIEDTKGVECRKDIGIIDESPRAYKNIDDVMNAQKDLVDIVHTLRAVLCVKG